MHEAGLAVAVAAAIREQGLRDMPVRLLVSGGHTDVEAFDASLRVHLGAVDPNLDLGLVSIVHVPRECTCLSCGQPFAAIGQFADCPRCGGVGLAKPVAESVEVVRERAAAGDRER